MKSVVTCVVLAAAFFVGVFVSTSARLSEPVAGALQLRAISQAIALDDKANASQTPEEEKVKLSASSRFAKLSADDSVGPSPIQKLSELVHALVGFLAALGAWGMQIATRVYGWLRNEVGMFSGDDDSDVEEEDEEEEDDVNTRLDKLEALIRQAIPQAPNYFPAPIPSPVAPRTPPASL